jgi:filamentous hemagglutinin
VTLADRSAQKVLVPRVYARVRDGDIDGSGGLLSDKDVDIRLSGNLVNADTIAGRDVVKVTADNVDNLGGRINGDRVTVAAQTDLNNIGGTISANSALVATAGRDINIETTTHSVSSMRGKTFGNGVVTDKVAGLYVTGDGSNGNGQLVVDAGRDVNLVAGQIGNAREGGATEITAGRDLNLTTVGTASSNSINWSAKNYRIESSTTEVGSQINANGAITLKAGGDIKARAADVQAGTALTAVAGNDIVLATGVHTVKVEEGHETTKKGFLRRKRCF